MRIAVIGAGSWGTTLAIKLAGMGHRVGLWEFRPDAAERLRAERENREFLPGFPLGEHIHPGSDIAEVIEAAHFCLLVVPSHVMRESLLKLKPSLPSGCIVVSATKGIEERTLLRMSELVGEVFGVDFDMGRFVCLSGPSHAEEVIRDLPTTVVAASNNLHSAREVQHLLSTERFRVYAHDDMTGVELGGSLKNVIAIASGIASGLGFGDNTMGALLTRGLAEITRLGVQLGGRPATFAGLSGMGDLITTCCSRHSRNRYVGEQLGKGRKLGQILAGMTMVAEGVRTTRSARELALREGVEKPITEQVYRILFEDADPLTATRELMTRELKIED